jgi:hypothetical protein
MSILTAFIRKYWAIIALSLLWLIIVFTNSQPNKLILGNDNFSPELNPQLTLSRSFLNPTWRTNRVLGIPSDSEQADWWRAGLFTILSPIIPTWIISQGYLFLTLLIAIISMSQLPKYFFKQNSPAIQFFSGFFYLTSLLTLWLYSYPVHLFIAAYAFTPLVLWRLLTTLRSPSRTNKIFLLLSSLTLGTVALTATMFITVFAIILYTSSAYLLTHAVSLKRYLLTLFILILPHLFWIPTFAMYVNTNHDDLQNSYINREITSSTIQSELSTNTPDNIIRFAGAWLDTKENGESFTYSFRDWYRNSSTTTYLGYLIPIIAMLGTLLALIQFRHNPSLLLLTPLPIIGFLLIKGANPPFNSLYLWLDSQIPLFHQVFRWGSSKFWPLLAIPLPIFASFLISKIRPTILKVITYPSLLIALIIYSYPIWTGNLIRSDSFVALPSEYTSLQQTLSPDSSQRIHTSPNTNTRYFRKHDWGFWGSVFLNYQLPNPTTEKALIIGSNENESAFTVIDSLYQSSNSTAYLNSLARYDITTILSDHSVTNTGLNDSFSYPYNWDLHDQMISNNTAISRVWQQDFLTLSTFESPSTHSTTPIYPHNPTTLNTLLALTSNSSPYHSSNTGYIYPLALNFSDFQVVDNTLVLTEQYLGDTATYTPNIPPTDRTLIELENNTILTSPYLPSLLVNDQSVWQPNLLTTPLNKHTPLISIDNITLFTGTQIVLNSLESANIRSWERSITSKPSLGRIRLTDCQGDNPGDGAITSTSPIQITTNSKSCLFADTDISSGGYISPTFTLTATQPVEVKVCIHSHLQDKCLNTPTLTTISTIPHDVSPQLNELVQAHDNLAVFLTVTPDSPTEITLSDFSITHHSPSAPISLTDSPDTNAPTPFTLNSGDNISLSIPITDSSINFPQSHLLPFQASCSDRGEANYPTFTINPLGGTTITSNNCFDGFYRSLGLVDSSTYPLILTAGKAENHSGIPLEINLKQDPLIRKPYTNLFREGPSSTIIALTPTQQGGGQFTTEIVNKGIGANSSVNTLQSAVTLPIPEDWLSLKLTPDNNTLLTLNGLSSLYPRDTGIYIGNITSDTELVTIPQATSPYWHAYIMDSQPRFFSAYLNIFTGNKLESSTLVNGWKQGWIIEQGHEDQWLVVIYLPNLVAYLGLILGMGTALGLSLRRQKST